MDFTLLKQLNTFFKKGPFSFTFKVEKKSDKFLMIDYEMIIKEVEIKGEDIAAYIEFNKVLDSVINKSIIYVNKENY